MRRIIIFWGVILCMILSGCSNSQDSKMDKESTTDSFQESKESTTEEKQKTTTKDGEEKEMADNKLALPSNAGALHVSGTQLMDQYDHPIQLKGISTHGIGWYPDYINQECFQDFQTEWNMNVIRLAMYTAEPSGYCTDGDQEALKDLVCKGVEYATKADMYVIIDWHILSDGDPNINKEAAKSFLQEMTQKFGKYENVIYEICNEPNGNVTWDTIKSYAEEVIPVIRANAKDAIIIVGTPTWSQDVDLAAENPIEGYDNLMYALHFYAGTHKENLREKMNIALEKGLPIFVSEYGICDASGNGALDLEEAGKWVDAMDENGLSYIMWNLSNKDESSAILKSTSTNQSNFTQDDLSQGGKWLKAMLTGDKEALKKLDNIDSAENIESIKTETVDGVEYNMEETNSWDSEGKHYHQYKITVTNHTGGTIRGWTISIDFDKEQRVSDHWNCDIEVSNQTVTLGSVSYNGYLEDGQSAEDVGMILIEN